MSILSSAQTKDEKTIAAQVESLRKAMQDADKATLEKLADDKLSYGHSGGKIEDKAAFVSNIVDGSSDFITLVFTDQKITIAGNTALVRHTLTAETNDGGKPGNVHLHVLLVWAKEGDQWKLLGRQAVKIPVPAT
ncbi:MAG TPA: nuclear transport factor 2 family protein [Chitinophaga sp.]|nr:nuclear transport factor 2 family protein [Chitinophaga sp.]